MCHSGRLYSCVRCQHQVIICRHCDRGNIYCSGECAKQSRHEKQQEASERYQSSHKGRQRHAQRQRQYRQRQRGSHQWQKEKVTHQGSPELAAYDSITTGLKTDNSRPTKRFFSKKSEWLCHFCGARCGEYLRWSFLHRQNHSLQAHSVF